MTWTLGLFEIWYPTIDNLSPFIGEAEAVLANPKQILEVKDTILQYATQAGIDYLKSAAPDQRPSHTHRLKRLLNDAFSDHTSSLQGRAVTAWSRLHLQYPEDFPLEEISRMVGTIADSKDAVESSQTAALFVIKELGMTQHTGFARQMLEAPSSDNVQFYAIQALAACGVRTDINALQTRVRRIPAIQKDTRNAVSEIENRSELRTIRSNRPATVQE